VTSRNFCTWLSLVVAPLVTKPADVTVVEVHRSGGTRLFLELRVAVDDYGRIVGKRGETIRGLRAVAAAAGGAHGLRVVLELQDATQRRPGGGATSA
jgi:predicted RNA-binding protein YlqC (UPF0109 family)